MKYVICLIPLLFACSTAPSHELLDCQENLVRFYRGHYKDIPYDDIEQVCKGELARKEMLDRIMRRR